MEWNELASELFESMAPAASAASSAQLTRSLINSINGIGCVRSASAAGGKPRPRN